MSEEKKNAAGVSSQSAGGGAMPPLHESLGRDKRRQRHVKVGIAIKPDPHRAMTQQFCSTPKPSPEHTIVVRTPAPETLNVTKI